MDKLITKSDMMDQINILSKNFPIECQEQAKKFFDCMFTLYHKLDFSDSRLEKHSEQIFKERIGPYCNHSYNLDECVNAIKHN